MPEPTGNKKWYVIKVQSGREDTIREAIERKVRIEPGEGGKRYVREESR